MNEMLADILNRCPLGFTVHEYGVDSFSGWFRIDPPNAIQPTTFDIQIAESSNGLEVSERVPGTMVPECCPERHINPDHTFCLGIDVGTSPMAARAIDDWWLLLEQFLRVQLVATRTGRWPNHQMLSHGAAGESHAKAVAIAARLGVSADYEAHLIGLRNWISELVEDYEEQQTLFSKKSLPVVHLSEERLAHAEEAIRASQPEDHFARRKHRRLLRRLAAHELKRVEQERDFWQACAAKEIKCCGTMITCPLRNAGPRKRAKR